MIGSRERILELLERRTSRSAAREPVRFGSILEEPRKILVVPSRGAKGFAFGIPSIVLLRERFPEARIHVLADSGSAEIFRRDPHVDAVHVMGESGSLLGVRGVMAFGRALAREEFDMALWLDDEVDAERRLAVQLSGGKVRIGRAEGDELFNCHFRYRGADGYPTLAQLALARRVARDAGTPEPRWRLDPKLRERARQLAHFWKPRREDYLVVVDPAAGIGGRGPGVETLARIVELLRKNYPCKVLVASEPAAAEAVRALSRESARWEPLLMPQPSLVETGAILSQADLLVSGNTALFHFAWVLGVPAIGLFGSHDDTRHVPPAGGSAVVIRSSEGLESQGFLERVNILLTKFPREFSRTP